MRSMRLLALPALLVVALSQPAATDDAKPIAPSGPWYVDDDKLFHGGTDDLTKLAKRHKCLAHDKLLEKMKPGAIALAFAAPAEKPLAAEEVYRLALPSVLAIISVYKDPKTGDWRDGIKASAWVATADGVLVTNWHVFEDLEPGEVFGAVDHTGRVYPMIDFLGGDKVGDVAAVRIAGAGFAPLPLAASHAPVGSWVGVLSHPGDHYYSFTQGHVTRYSKTRNAEGKDERWMGITAEYASGSSGAPVLDSRGAVVGMTSSTITFDAPQEDEKPKQKERRRLGNRAPGEEKPAPKGPLVQMVAKLAVPGPVLRESFGK